MNHEETIREIHRRLPRLKRRDVADVLEVMAEVWLATLCQPGASVTVGDLGRLAVTVQSLRSGGVVGARDVRRLVVRFRPTAKFRQAMLYKEGESE